MRIREHRPAACALGLALLASSIQGTLYAGITPAGDGNGATFSDDYLDQNYLDTSNLNNVVVNTNAPGTVHPNGIVVNAPMQALGSSLLVMHMEDGAQGGGQSVLDAGDYAHHGITNGGVDMSVPGRYGKGIHFDGGANGGSNISLGDPTAMRFEADRPFTLAAWIKSDDGAGSKGIVGRKTSAPSSAYGLGLQINSAGYLFGFTGYSGPSAVCNDPADNIDQHIGAWLHVAFSFDGSTGRVYLNGTQCALQTGMVQPGGFTASADWRIGNSGNRGNPGGDFLGTIDEAAIFDAVLSPLQINDLYRGRVVSGSLQSYDNIGASPWIELGAQYNSLRLNLSHDQAGAARVALSSDNVNWTPIRDGQTLTPSFAPKLLPANRLRYRIEFAGDDLLDRIDLTWKNVDLDGPGEGFAYMAFSDHYSGFDGGLRDTLKHAWNGTPLAFIASNGDTPGYDRVDNVIQTTLGGYFTDTPHVPWHPAVGNHELDGSPPGANMQWYAANLAPRIHYQLPGIRNHNPGPAGAIAGTSYSFDYKLAHMVYLNLYQYVTIEVSNGAVTQRVPYAQRVDGTYASGWSVVNGSYRIEQELLGWLERDLARTSQPYIFIHFHEMAYPVQHSPSGGPPLDGIYPPLLTPADQANWGIGVSEHNQTSVSRSVNRDDFWRLLQTYRVSASFAGHDHAYSRRCPHVDDAGSLSWGMDCASTNGVYQIDTGRVYSSYSHYLIVKPDSAQAAFEAWYAPGNNADGFYLIDSWTVSPRTGIANQAPRALFDMTPAGGAAPIDIAFDAAEAYDPEATIAAYEWDFDYDGTNFNIGATGVNTTHRYSNAGTYRIALRVRDAQGLSDLREARLSLSQADLTPPVIGNPRAETLLSTLARVSWDTDEAATGYVEYGTSTGLGNTLNTPPSRATSHRLDLTGLTPNTLYYYRVFASDASANQAASGIFTFTTPLSDPPAKTLYVDKLLSGDCAGNYSLQSRACDGGDGDKYDSLNQAASAALPGDTVSIRAGSYNETLIPSVSGLPGRPITIRAYGNETVNVASPPNFLGNYPVPAGESGDMDYRYGIYLYEVEHLIIRGLRVNNVEGWLRALRAHNNEIRGNRFSATPNGVGDTAGLKFIDSHYNRVVDNVITQGTDNVTFMDSNYNLLAGNDISEGRHSIFGIRCGDYNIVRGNTFSNTMQKIGEVYDCGADTNDVANDFDSTKYNLIERNVFDITAPDDGNGPYNGMQYAGQHGIIRFNVFSRARGGGLGMAYYGDEALHNKHNRVYHNVFYGNTGAGVEAGISNANADFLDNVFKNNVIAANEPHPLGWADNTLGGTQITHRYPAGVLFERNNILNATSGQDVVWAARVNYSLIEAQSQFPDMYRLNIELWPGFVDAANRDFRLAPGSAMRDRGAPLTRASSSGSGTRLSVDDAGYFFAGFGIAGESGDRIQLLGTTQTARVLDVDYLNNSLTLDGPLNWSAGQGVTLAYRGSAPDIGAFEGNSPDLNNDGGVDSLDLGILLNQWGGAGSADLNLDGTVDEGDMQVLLGEL